MLRQWEHSAETVQAARQDILNDTAHWSWAAFILKCRMPYAKGIEQNRKIIRQADEKIENTVGQIRQGTYSQEGLSLIAHMAGLFGKRLWFYRKTVGYTDKLKISDNCTGCGLCVSLCPMENILIKDGRAVADNKYTMCYRCISRCPQKRSRFWVMRLWNSASMIGMSVQRLMDSGI